MSTFRAKQLIRDNLNIPTLPVVIQRITALIDDPESGTAEIGQVISEDAPLAAKMLRIANSAYYGLRERCLSTEQASSVLGLRVLNNVVTQAAVIQQFNHLSEFSSFDIDGLWRHSILVAQGCAHMARRCTGAIGLAPEEFHICGLLHDLGKIVMLDSMGTEYLEVYKESQQVGGPLHVIEEKRLGFNHTDVGAMVSVRWSLPAAASAAIQFHHGPRENVREDPVVALVANVNLVCHRVEAGDLGAAVATLDPETAGILGLAYGEVEEIVEFLDQTRTEIVL
jgi:HD-like signal output (HDOD) protein